MERHIPVNLLMLLERWFTVGMTCVKWYNVWSSWFSLSCGIRQGGVLSPHLFAVYIDSLISKVQSCGLGCYVRHISFNLLLYADDILLSAPSVSALQSLLHVCEQELLQLYMAINLRKSSCTHIGARFNSDAIKTFFQDQDQDFAFQDQGPYLFVMYTRGRPKSIFHFRP